MTDRNSTSIDESSEVDLTGKISYPDYWLMYFELWSYENEVFILPQNFNVAILPKICLDVCHTSIYISDPFMVIKIRKMHLICQNRMIEQILWYAIIIWLLARNNAVYSAVVTELARELVSTLSPEQLVYACRGFHN